MGQHGTTDHVSESSHPHRQPARRRISDGQLAAGAAAAAPPPPPRWHLCWHGARPARRSPRCSGCDRRQHGMHALLGPLERAAPQDIDVVDDAHAAPLGVAQVAFLKALYRAGSSVTCSPRSKSGATGHTDWSLGSLEIAQTRAVPTARGDAAVHLPQREALEAEDDAGRGTRASGQMFFRAACMHTAKTTRSMCM